MKKLFATSLTCVIHQAFIELDNQCKVARTNAYYYSFFPHVTFLELPSTYCSSGTE